MKLNDSAANLNETYEIIENTSYKMDPLILSSSTSFVCSTPKPTNEVFEGRISPCKFF